jgi:hypothetical protein
MEVDKRLTVIVVIVSFIVFVILGLISIKINIENNKNINQTNISYKNIESGNLQLDTITAVLIDKETEEDPILCEEGLIDFFDIT